MPSWETRESFAVGIVDAEAAGDVDEMPMEERKEQIERHEKRRDKN